MLEFPTNYAPIVGQQTTRTASNAAVVDPRIDLLLDRHDNPDNPDDPDDLNSPECDVVAKGTVDGEARGYVYMGGGNWQSDREAEATVTDAALRLETATAGQEITFTAVPPGEGYRIGIDRDVDGFLDADELDGGSNPASALSLLCNTTDAFGDKDRASIKDAKGQLNLKAAIVLGTYDAETIQVVVEDGGGTIFDSGILGSALELNTSGTTYKFKSNDGGITTVQLKKDTKVAGGFRVKVRTREAWAPGTADESEATTLVRLNIGGTCLAGNASRVD
jgi:hypothetical protein